MLKKKWLWYPGFFILSLLWILWMNQGCNGKIPPLSNVLAVAPTPLPSYFISDFETGKIGLNTHLQGYVGGNWAAATYGGSTAAPNAVDAIFVLPNPGDGSNFAAHVFGVMTDPGGTQYPSDQLGCFLSDNSSTPYFDASLFTGIQFDINIMPDDTNNFTRGRIFQVATDATVPPPQIPGGRAGGRCTQGANCFNHYEYSLPGPTGGWITLTLTWAMFNQAYGTTYGPLSNHLDKFILLQWQFGDNGAGTVTYTDFWVDNVQFLP